MNNLFIVIIFSYMMCVPCTAKLDYNLPTSINGMDNFMIVFKKIKT